MNNPVIELVTFKAKRGVSSEALNKGCC